MLGIVLVAWPQATIVVLMVLVGIWALIDGIGLAAQVFAKGASAGQRVFFGVMALIALVVALVAIFRPGTAASVVTWSSASGCSCVVCSSWSARSAPPSPPRAGCSCSAPCSTWCSAGCSSPTPARRPWPWPCVIGMLAIAWGVVFVVLALAARSATKDLPGDSSLPPVIPAPRSDPTA